MTLNTYVKYLTYFETKPRQKYRSFDEALVFDHAVTLRSGRIWIGYDQGSQFEAGVKVWLRPMGPDGPTGNVYLGGAYLHKHSTSAMYQNDYYHLWELGELAPIEAPAGSIIFIDRDIFNIDRWRSFNALDVELILVVDE
jgi:hypothetical protein